MIGNRINSVLLGLFLLHAVNGFGRGDIESCKELVTAGIKPNENLRMRSSASLSASIVGQIRADDALRAQERTKGQFVDDAEFPDWATDLWINVVNEAGDSGWVTATYLRCAETSCPMPETFNFTWPVPSSRRITQAFGNLDAIYPCGKHTGIDIGAPLGRSIVSVEAGKVIYVGKMWEHPDYPESRRGEHAVIIDHGRSVYSTYAHNVRTHVQAGDCVARGEHIGDVGTEGFSTGPHLHFEFIQSLPFSGDWRTPFENDCPFYLNPSRSL